MSHTIYLLINNLPATRSKRIVKQTGKSLVLHQQQEERGEAEEVTRKTWKREGQGVWRRGGEWAGGAGARSERGVGEGGSGE